MTFVRANPASWALYELLTSSQMNDIDTNMTFALDGRDGGNYSPEDSLILDGVDSLNDTLRLHAPTLTTKYALDILLDNGSGRAVHITADGIPDVTMFLIDGEELAEPADATAMIINANSSSAGIGSTAFKGFGGYTSFSGSEGGRGLVGVGGDGTAANTEGGVGVNGVGGISDFTGDVGQRFAAHGVQGEGGAMLGDDPLHVAGFGLRGIGGDASADGKGGAGCYGSGGLGPSATVSGTDTGMGIVGRGFHGAIGTTFALDPFELPAEFLSNTKRVGVVAAAKGYGLAFYSEYSGQSAESQVNKFAWVGAGSSGLGRVICSVASELTSAPTSTVVGLSSFDISGLSDIAFKAVRAAGHGAPGLEVDSAFGNSVQPPAMQFIRQDRPDDTSFIIGGLAYVSEGEVTGMLDDALYVGVPDAGIYDRVVTSGDRGAVQAWGRITVTGNVATLGSNYGVASVALDNVIVDVIRVTLDTIAGQPLDTSMIIMATTNYGSAIPSFQIEDANNFLLFFYDAVGAAYVDLNTATIEVHFTVHGAPAVGTAADRPTYYTP